MAVLPAQTEFESWSAAGSGLRVEYPAALLEQICNEAIEALDAAYGGAGTGGVLFGTYADGTVRVMASRPLACEHAYGRRFLLSERDCENLRLLLSAPRRDAGLRGLVPVGWYHSIPRGGPALTARDAEVHDRFFPRPWHLAVAIHPEREEPSAVAFCVRDGASRALFKTRVQARKRPAAELARERAAEEPAPGAVIPEARQAAVPAQPEGSPHWEARSEQAASGPAVPEGGPRQGPGAGCGPEREAGHSAAADTPGHAAGRAIPIEKLGPELSEEAPATERAATVPGVVAGAPGAALAPGTSMESPVAAAPVEKALPAGAVSGEGGPAAPAAFEPPPAPLLTISRSQRALFPAGTKPEGPVTGATAGGDVAPEGIEAAVGESPAAHRRASERDGGDFEAPLPAWARAGETQKRRRWWVWAICAVVLIAAIAGGGAWYFGGAGAKPELALWVTDLGGQLMIEWDRAAKPVQRAVGGSLEIVDGGEHLAIKMDGEKLREGSVDYVRRSEVVDVKLTVSLPGGRTVADSIRFLGPPVARVPVDDVVRERDALKQQVDRLKAELNSER